MVDSSGMLPYVIFVGEVEGQKSYALPYQIKSIDTKRLRNRIGLLEQNKYDLLKEILRGYF